MNVQGASDRRNTFRVNWKAPLSYDGFEVGQNTTVFNFYWQVKGPKQVGREPWRTQYKIEKSQDLEYFNAGNGIAASSSLLALGILQFALAKMAL